MRPYAPTVLLALTGTNEAAEIYRETLRGPYRHQREYDKIGIVKKAPFPTAASSNYAPFFSGSLSSSSTRESSSTSSTYSSETPNLRLTYDPTSTSASSSSSSSSSGSKNNSSETESELYSYDLTTSLNSSSRGPTASFSYDPSTTSTSVDESLTAGGIFASGTAPSRPAFSPFNGSVGFTGELPTGTRPPFPNPPRPTNGTCGGATLNIRNASLEWWYPETYTQVDSTFSIQFNANDSSTGWTLLSATDTLNVTSAIEAPSCTSVTAFNTEYNETMLEYSCWETPTPIAAATTTVEQTAYKEINQTSAKGTIPNVVVTPTPAVASAGDFASTYSSGTPFVHFSEYDVVSKRSVRYYNGDVDCITTTKVHTLSEPVSFEYTGEEEVNALQAKGKLKAAVLRAVEEDSGVSLSSVSLGTFQAQPTVIVVVAKVLAAQGVLAKGTAESASELDTPTPTLPSGLSVVQTTPTETGIIWIPLTAHIESSAESLLVPERTTENRLSVQMSVSTKKSSQTVVPFLAHIESSDVTLAIPVDKTATNNVVTAVFSGKTVTATRVANQAAPGDEWVGRILSAVVSAAQPTDAAQLLSNAMLTFPQHSPTVGAIASAIGGSSNPGGGNGNGGTGSGSNANPVLSIGDSVFTATRAGGAVLVGGQTASAGGPAVTIHGIPVSVVSGGNAVVIAGSTTHLSAPTNVGAAANIPLITVGSQVLTANAATQFNIGGSVLAPGGFVVFSGSTFSLAPGATQLLVNGQTRDLSPPAITPAPLLTIGNTVYKPNSGSTYDIAGKFLVPGGAVVVSDTTISLPADGSNIVINGLIQPIGSGGADVDMAIITAPPVLTVDGKAVSPNGDTSYIISGQTLTPGGVITIDGSNGRQTVSLNSEAVELVSIINGQTVTSYIGMIGAASGGAPLITVDGVTYTAVDYNAGSGATYVIDGHTLTPSGSITISGPNGPETISLLPDGMAIVLASDGHTTTSSIDGAYGVLPTAAPILTIDGETFTAYYGTTYIVDGKTLTPDDIETVTINDHTFILSLSPQATLLEIVELGPNGQPITTVYETLFPATALGATTTDTLVDAPTAAQGASATTPAAPTGSDEDSETNRASSSRIFELTAVAITFISFAFAIWL